MGWIERVALLVLFCGIGLAQDSNCLFIGSTKVDPDRFGFSMTLINRCGKAVTAYGISATVGFNDGSTAEHESMRQDYLPSLAFDKGYIRPAEARDTPFWGVPRSQGDIDNAIQLVEVRPRIRFVAFLDRTAVGDERGIEQLFASRRHELRDLRHWKTQLTAAKTAGKGAPEILRMQGAGRPGRVLEELGRKAESKAITNEAAMERFENYLDAQITAASIHSVRER